MPKNMLAPHGDGRRVEFTTAEGDRVAGRVELGPFDEELVAQIYAGEAPKNDEVSDDWAIVRDRGQRTFSQQHSLMEPCIGARSTTVSVVTNNNSWHSPQL